LCAVAPFSRIRLLETSGFISAVQAIIFVTDLTTAILLFAQVSLTRSYALLALANGYLFTAFIVVAHTLTFPGALAPQGLLASGLQTTGWLHIIWHFSFPFAVIVYVVLKDGFGANATIRLSIRSLICGSTIAVITLVCGIVWLLARTDDALPRLFLDRATFSPLVFYTGAFDAVVCSIAFLFLFMRKRSILDEWLSISVAATLAEMTMVTFFSGGRYDFGWYSVRLFSLVSSTAVFLALLTEITRLYAKIFAANRLLQRQHDNKLLSAQAATAAIAHEIVQPLAVIALNGEAARGFLGESRPDLEEVRECLDTMLEQCQRTSETIQAIRSLFRRFDQPGQPIDLNEIILTVLHWQEPELARQGVEIRCKLTADLPLVSGYRAQLEEVIVNLVNNAAEAMDTTTTRSRLLTIETALRRRDSICMEIEDSGPGIDPDRLGEIFDAFVTTKSRGTGLGLAICRMVIENHGGELTASSDGRSGTKFRITLPKMVAVASLSGVANSDKRKLSAEPIVSARPA
jgi:signal transduction histidine kinase